MRLTDFEDAFLDVVSVMDKNRDNLDFSYLYVQLTPSVEEDEKGMVLSRACQRIPVNYLLAFLEILSKSESQKEVFLSRCIDVLLSDNELRKAFMKTLNTALSDVRRS